MGRHLLQDLVTLEDHFTPNFASQPFKRTRQSTETVLTICNEFGLDPDNRKDRMKAQGTGKRLVEALFRDLIQILNAGFEQQHPCGERVQGAI